MKRLTLFATLALGVALAGCTGAGTSLSAPAPGVADDRAPTPLPAIGSVVVADGWTLRAIGTETIDAIPGRADLRPAGTWLGVTLELTNRRADTAYPTANWYRLAGAERAYDHEALTARSALLRARQRAGQPALRAVDAPIPPGTTVQMLLLFDVAKADSPTAPDHGPLVLTFTPPLRPSTTIRLA